MILDKPWMKARKNNGVQFEPDASTVLWLPGQDDAYSSTIRDHSGYGNNGTIVGATWERLSSGLWYLSFDGTNDSIEISDDASLYPASGTIEFWVYRDDRGNIQYLYCDYGTTSPRIYWANGTDIITIITGTCYVDATATTSATQQVWHHIVVSGINLSGGSGGLWFARRWDGSATYALPGDMALIRIYNSALTAPEIANHFNQERHLFGV